MIMTMTTMMPYLTEPKQTVKLAMRRQIIATRTIQYALPSLAGLAGAALLMRWRASMNKTESRIKATRVTKNAKLATVPFATSLNEISFEPSIDLGMRLPMNDPQISRITFVVKEMIIANKVIPAATG